MRARPDRQDGKGRTGCPGPAIHLEAFEGSGFPTEAVAGHRLAARLG